MRIFKRQSDDTILCPAIIPNVMTDHGFQVFIGVYDPINKLVLNSHDYVFFETLEEAHAYVRGFLKALPHEVLE